MSRTTGNTMSSTGGRARGTDIKPADVYELRLKTSHLQLRTRQLRSKLNRLQDRIVASTNAINKTFEQESDQPAVTSNHTNSVPQLRRSVESAANTLESLHETIDQTRYDDKTYIVKELQEEVKLAYCEHQRLAMELQDSKIEVNESTQKRKEAEERISTQHIKELKAKNLQLQAENASLRDKAVAYKMKQKKLQIDQEISNHAKNKQPVEKTIKEADQKAQEMNEKLIQLAKELNESKEKHQQKIQELKNLIEEQKQKIQDFLDGNLQIEQNNEEENKNENENENEQNENENNQEY